jgi:hypothetical protein
MDTPRNYRTRGRETNDDESNNLATMVEPARNRLTRYQVELIAGLIAEKGLFLIEACNSVGVSWISLGNALRDPENADWKELIEEARQHGADMYTRVMMDETDDAGLSDLMMAQPKLAETRARALQFAITHMKGRPRAPAVTVKGGDPNNPSGAALFTVVVGATEEN